ncbi:hypothetical protein [Bacillus seohaeanensis]|uniref:hypothetical protein n=1 Tax=Bacillus seohaeanensis TaxID=284580 RepID=UPI0036707B29
MNPVTHFGILLLLWLAIYLFIRKDFTKGCLDAKKVFLSIVKSLRITKINR